MGCCADGDEPIGLISGKPSRNNATVAFEAAEFDDVKYTGEKAGMLKLNVQLDEIWD